MAGQDIPGVPDSSGKSVSAIAPLANDAARDSILIQSAILQSERAIQRGQRRRKDCLGHVELLVSADQDQYVSRFHFGIG